MDTMLNAAAQGGTELLPLKEDTMSESLPGDPCSAPGNVIILSSNMCGSVSPEGLVTNKRKTCAFQASLCFQLSERTLCGGGQARFKARGGQVLLNLFLGL